jgi:hypothetical protein
VNALPMIPVTGWSPLMATAVHESGHAVAAYLLGCELGRVSVIPDADSAGRVHIPPPREAVLAGLSGDTLRSVLEDQAAVRVAGMLAGEVWAAVQPGAPDREGTAVKGAESDAGQAAGFAEAAALLTGETTGDCAERIAHRVRSWVLPGAVPAERGGDYRYSSGADRFWPLAGALATELASAGDLSGKQARKILRAADPLYGPARSENARDASHAPP